MLFDFSLAPPPFPIIDCHIHLGSSDTDEIYYPTLESAEALAWMDEFNIRHTCAFAPYRTDGYLAINQQMRDWAAASDGRILPFARLGGRQPVTEPALWMVRRALRDRLQTRLPDVDDLAQFAGVKLLPHLDGVPDDATFTTINNLGLPTLIHGGNYSSPRWIAKNILPKLTGVLIIAHLGAFPAADPLLFDALELAEQSPQVYLDTSGVLISAFLTEAVRRVPNKLLFGSDAPLTHPMVAWLQLASVVRDVGILRQIGHDTATRILKIDQK